MGTVLGVGALVTTLGLSATASHQVSDRFDAIRATEVVVQDARETDTTAPFPADTDRRLARLNGVVNAGTITQFADLPITTKPSTDTSSPDGPELPMFAASPGAVRALRPTIGTGRLYDQGHEQRRDAVALLGRAAAQQLGISRIDNAPAVFIGDQAFAVIGIVDDVARRAEVLSAVVIPHRFAEGLTGGKPRKPEVEIDTMPGAAATIARQAPYALRPDDPTRLQALAPPDPDTLRNQVEGDVNALFLALAGISLLIGSASIANVTLVGVLERIPEIGLRRALGARPRHIAAHFLAETIAIGTTGGMLGASIGIVIVAAVAAAKEWTPVLDPTLPLLAPALGSIAGLIAGLYPSWRATRIEPVEALRR